MKKSNDQIAQDYKNKKRVFLSKLKNSPYSDKLISIWMKTFNDDSICIQFIQAIELTNSQWKEHKKDGTGIDEFVEAIYNSYRNIQDIPHNLTIAILIGSCNEISNTFIANEALKNITTYVIME
jgi:hypothetical protein